MKFMAVPNYTYLKLKMPGPRGVIIVGTSFQRAYECEVQCCKHATKVLRPGTYKLKTINGKVFVNAWNIEQLHHFYP